MLFLNCPYTEEEVSETLDYEGGPCGERLSLEIKGLTPERSYEDRDVFLNFLEEDTEDRRVRSSSLWLRGEDAIELGIKLIQHGNRALSFNRQQLFHYMGIQRFQRYVNENRVSKVTLTCLDRNCLNYGSGFFLFRIEPTWKENRAPEYGEDFSLDSVINFSPFEEEFKEQIAFFKCPVYFENYSHEDEVALFKKRCVEHQRPILATSVEENLEL